MSPSSPPADPEPGLLPVLRVGSEPPAVVDAVEQAGQVALGAALLLADGIGAVFRRVEPDTGGAHPPTGPSAAVAARRVAVGLAFEAQRRAVGTAEATAKVVMPTVGWVLSSPVAQPVVRRVADGLERAYQAGLLEEDVARDLATRTGEETINLVIPVVLSEVDLKPVIEQVLDELDLPVLVDNVMGELDLDPIVQRVLGQLDMAGLVNDVVGEIQMSSVVMQATGGITEDILGQVRNRSADGDVLVERIIAKVLRRRVADLPPKAFPDDQHDPGRAQ